MIKFLLNTSILLFITFQISFAADRYWIAASSSNWNNTANWSSTSGGAGGASVPAVGDIAVFDAGGLGDCSFDLNVGVEGLNVLSGYTGTISQGGFALLVNLSNIVLTGGTFVGGTANITSNSSFTIAGTDFTSTSAILSVRGNFDFSGGTFAHNNGTVNYKTGKTITGSIALNNASFEGIGGGNVMTLANSAILTVTGTLTLKAGGVFEFNGGTIEAKGDIFAINSGTDGTTNLEINGTGNQLLTGHIVTNNQGALPNVIINKPSGTLTLLYTVTVSGDWTYIQGNIDATTNASTVLFHTSKTISGTHGLHHITFQPAGGTTFEISIAPQTCITTTGTLTFQGANGYFLNGGTIDAKGDIISLRGSRGTATINICGTGNQVL
ncbi:MAG: hypothetical protein JKX73_07565, partial [Flavobacteriales bacterium]|nr:hypothetical protein [Flavobacteriales bacterium]